MTVRPVRLEAGDAVELGEMLGFLSRWLAEDHVALSASLSRSVSTVYDLDTLRADVLRFEFLLGGSDGESLFGVGEP